MNITLGVQSAIVPDQAAAQHAKLVDAAQQFEGILLQEMLKGMQGGKDSLSGSEGDDGDDDSNDTLRSFGTESVAHAIAKGGGVGIARQVVAKVALEHAQQHGAGQALAGHDLSSQNHQIQTKVFQAQADRLK